MRGRERGALTASRQLRTGRLLQPPSFNRGARTPPLPLLKVVFKFRPLFSLYFLPHLVLSLLIGLRVGGLEGGVRRDSFDLLVGGGVRSPAGASRHSF